MSPPAIAPKRINLQFTLLPTTPGGTPPSFATTGTPTKDVTGLRVRCTVIKQGGLGMNTVQLEIYGMNISDMNQLSTLGLRVQYVQKSLITVQAGDFLSGSLFTVAKNATVFSAYTDLNGSSNVPFRVTAQQGGYESVIGIPPTAMKGSFKLSVAMAQIASAGGLNFENDLGSADPVLRDRTYVGSVRQQAIKLAQEGNVIWSLDDATIAVWPKNGSRTGPMVIMSSATGMIAYPSCTAYGLFVKSQYNPQLRVGGQFQVNLLPLNPNDPLSQLVLPANKNWTIATLEHHLDSGQPGGQWFSSMEAYDSAFGTPSVQPS